MWPCRNALQGDHGPPTINLQYQPLQDVFHVSCVFHLIYWFVSVRWISSSAFPRTGRPSSSLQELRPLIPSGRHTATSFRVAENTQLTVQSKHHLIVFICTWCQRRRTKRNTAALSALSKRSLQYLPWPAKTLEYLVFACVCTFSKRSEEPAFAWSSVASPQVASEWPGNAAHHV